MQHLRLFDAPQLPTTIAQCPYGTLSGANVATGLSFPHDRHRQSVAGAWFAAAKLTTRPHDYCQPLMGIDVFIRAAGSGSSSDIKTAPVAP
jgi:hypothetical protein